MANLVMVSYSCKLSFNSRVERFTSIIIDVATALREQFQYGEAFARSPMPTCLFPA